MQLVRYYNDDAPSQAQKLTNMNLINDVLKVLIDFADHLRMCALFGNNFRFFMGGKLETKFICFFLIYV